MTSEPTPLQKAAIRYAALRTQLEQALSEIGRLREHQKGIVQGATPLEIAERILAEHDGNIPRGASREKLDDELCRMCALASTIKAGVERETALREALEDCLHQIGNMWTYLNVPSEDWPRLKNEVARGVGRTDSYNSGAEYAWKLNWKAFQRGSDLINGKRSPRALSGDGSQ